MSKAKYFIFLLLQFISLSFYAQNASNIILGDVFNQHSETLSAERFDWASLPESAAEQLPELNEHAPIVNNKRTSVAIPDSTDRPIIKVAPNAEDRTSLGQPRSTKSNRADDRGLTWSIGYGFGYSSHAAAYFVQEDFRVKDFSGIRVIVLDSKIGWRFGERIGLFGTWKYSPGNSTISPYRSTYFGGALAFYFEGLSIHGGIGTFQSKLEKNEIAGKGRLTNLGITLHLTSNFACELNVLTGKMQPGDVVPYLVDSTEFNFTVGMAYLF